MNADPPIARYVPHSPDSIVPMNMCGTSYERLLVAPFHDGNPGISLKALAAVPTHREACKKKIPYLHPKLPTNVVEIQLPLVRKNRYGRHSTVIEGARLALLRVPRYRYPGSDPAIPRNLYIVDDG